MAKLTKRERQEIKEFTELVKKECGKKIRVIKLFGSAARNKINKDSDLDIFFVVKGEWLKIFHKIISISTDICLKYGRYISPKVYEEKRYKYLKQIYSPFIQNVEKEGKIIWKNY
ncbi:MAG: nucleotidyltransferase domain-containing protein [Elusimicrobiota bacterium]